MYIVDREIVILWTQGYRDTYKHSYIDTVSAIHEYNDIRIHGYKKYRIRNTRIQEIEEIKYIRIHRFNKDTRIQG